MNLEQSIVNHLGITITYVAEGVCIGTMPVDARTHQPFGYLHGGASVVLAETLASAGTIHLINTKEEICFGLEINANHLRTVQSGNVTGKATLIDRTRTIAVWEIKITDEKDQLICISRCTVAIRKLRV
ncbi:MAG: hotdog fold thioesterase [Bacilli bacterium]